MPCNECVYISLFKIKRKTAPGCTCTAGPTPACGSYSGLQCNGCAGKPTGTALPSTDCLVCSQPTDVYKDNKNTLT